MSEENVEIARRLAEKISSSAPLMNAGRFEQVALDFESAPIAGDFELVPAVELQGRQVYRGIAGVVEFMRMWLEDFEEWSIDHEDFIDAPHDRVAVMARQRAIGTASGAPVDLRFGMVAEMRDREVTRLRLFLDPSEALEAAGLSE